MFIKLHHKNSGREFYIPASHILIIDGAEEADPKDIRAPPIKKTVIRTMIMMGDKSVTFEVRESPEEVATLVNEMLNMAARQSRMN